MSTNQNLVLLNEMATFVKVVESESFSETARQGNSELRLLLLAVRLPV